MVLSYNLPHGVHYDGRQWVADRPANTRKGGGIFLHVNGDGATAGCVSVSRPMMARLLRWLDPAREPRIVMGPAARVPPLRPRADAGRAATAGGREPPRSGPDTGPYGPERVRYLAARRVPIGLNQGISDRLRLEVPARTWLASSLVPAPRSVAPASASGPSAGVLRRLERLTAGMENSRPRP